MLKKKHHGCAYHQAREAIAARIIHFAHVDSKDNYADLLTKPLGRATFSKLTREVMFRKPKVYDKADVLDNMDPQDQTDA